ncbi:hypothetical protein JY97_11315 [Alkalispirochaeta odontotermitis]|nr:hypothetical protein JY97_11315 [Alkalispirochaeta odontotermitis]CAB1076585.1 hypothetical protein D1AOALGA4SA_4381 [Olavius algarvensis Delta 1 endosymbiont]
MTYIVEKIETSRIEPLFNLKQDGFQIHCPFLCSIMIRRALADRIKILILSHLILSLIKV